MTRVNRVLDAQPVADLGEYLERGGGRALAAAAEVDPEDLTAAVADAGLRGRGGAGFPTAVKWRTVTENRSRIDPTAVIVNAAEGEPGTFKDRAILRSNPYRVIEGALIAARAVGAPRVVVALKSSFSAEIDRVRRAIGEFGAHGLYDIECDIVEGPSSYLFGEESAMLEVAEGRQPFPRVTPPYRRGIDDPESGSGNAASWVGLAGDSLADGPALVDNVETLANVPGIVLEGPDWFREFGTPDSPGTIVCTVSGDTRRHGVGEFAMGTPLWDVLEELGGGPRDGRTLVAAMSGTANSVLPGDRFDTPLTYEAMTAAGAGLGTGGFIVFDDEADLVAVAHGISRFLAVESCGQCTPCKDDGLAISEHLDAIRQSNATPRDVAALDQRLTTVADGARCGLAAQQQYAVGSLIDLARSTVRAHVDRRLGASGPYLIAPIVDIVDGRAEIDMAQLDKHPDWTTGGTDSGSSPAELYGGGPVEVSVRSAGEDAPADVAEIPVEDTPSDRDYFGVLRQHHDRVREALNIAVEASGPARGPAFAELDHHVRRYLDLTGRVLYPTLSRATFTTGDDVAWAAEHDAQRALDLIERLHRESSDVGGEARERRQFDELVEELAELCRCDEEVVIPMLLDRLDAGQLDDLADALEEADARPDESDAGARFGSSPG